MFPKYGGSWTSYDSAAECHDRLAAPSFFEQPARDLVARIDARSAARILDVGTGSGLAALLAAKVADSQAIVVGLDPSIEMLRIARRHGLRQVVSGGLPGLPFTDRIFDRILVWQSLPESFISQKLLAEATREALPREDWFTDPGHVDHALQGAGLTNVEVHPALYVIHTNIADFLAIREASLQARFMRQNLDASRWDRFKETAMTEFHRRFKDPIDHRRDVLIAVGTRP